VVGRGEVGADPQRHGDLESGEDGEGDGHGRDGAPDQRPGGDAEGEGERRVTDGRDAVGGEDQLGEPALGERAGGGAVVGGPAERRRPPGLYQAQSLGDGHGGQAADGEHHQQ